MNALTRRTGGVPNWIWGLLGLGGLGGLTFLWFRGFGDGTNPGGMPFVMPGTKAHFIQTLWGAFNRVAPELTPGTRVLIIAHGAYETGWGTNRVAKAGTFNFWNLTKGSDALWPKSKPIFEGGDTSYNVSECAKLGRPMDRDGGKACYKGTAFRRYGSVDEAVTDYLTFLGYTRYREAKRLLLAGDLTFVSELGNAGFYTLPVPRYVAGFVADLGRVNAALSDAIR